MMFNFQYVYNKYLRSNDIVDVPLILKILFFFHDDAKM